MMGLFSDIFTRLFNQATQAAMSAGRDVRLDELDHPNAASPVHDLSQRFGSFIVVDLYPKDLGGRPNWQALGGAAKVGKYEVVGAYLKATEGTKYGYTEWFVRNIQQLRQLYDGRLKDDRFIGGYHFLQITSDPVAQADFFAKTLERAGGFTEGDLLPMLDFEQGGQYNFIPKDCPRDEKGRQDLSKLPDATRRDMAKRALESAHSFTTRFKQATGLPCALYGRGLQRDLGMTLDRGYTQAMLRMGCVRAVNPAYTAVIPPMDRYGWPLQDVGLWQAGGDGTSALPGFPHSIPGFGAVDMSVHIDGTNRTSLDSFRRNCCV